MSDLITLSTGEVLDVSAYPLPAGVVDEFMNLKTLARAMQRSGVTITQWVDQGMPVHEAGGNGRAYTFRLSHCHAWRMWREDRQNEQQRKADSTADQYALMFLGGEDQVPDVPALTPKQMREYAEAELKRNQAAEQRGDLMRRLHVETAMEDVLVAFRSGVASLPDWLEQEFSLSPAQVDKAQSYIDGLLTDVRQRLTRSGVQVADVVRFEAVDRNA